MNWSGGCGRKVGALAACLCLGFADLSIATESPFSAQVQPLALRPRTAAPAFIDVQLRSRRQAITEGTLELQVMSGNEPLFRQQTSALALAPGSTSRRLLLPFVPANSGVGIDVQLRFLTRDATHDLGRFPIAAESFVATRQYLIGICGTVPAPARDEPQFWQALRPERALPESDKRPWQISSMPVWFAPEDLPSTLGLCAFDLVIVQAPALAALSEKQLAQLAAWVEAGGSLCVAPGKTLAAPQLAFLNALASPADAEPALRVGPEDKVIRPNESIIFRRPGLGRLMLMWEPLADEAELKTPLTQRAAWFLAQVQSEYLDKPASLHGGIWQNWFSRPQERANEIQERLFELLPKSSRMIPLPVLGAILGVFVLIAGPGEWFVLGLLRGRRWTWLTFPALAMGCTVVAVRAAEHYLGRDDQRAALILTDVDPRGRVLRENRIELWFAGRNGEAVSEQRQALAIPCSFAKGSTSAGESGGALYQGQMPAHYVLRQPLAQWQPLLRRTMSLEPRAESSRLRWTALHAHDLAGRPRPARDVAEKLAADAWTVWVYHSSMVDASPPVHHEGPDDGWPVGDAMDKLIQHLSKLGRPFTSLAPSGRPDLLDLAMHDASDPREWLVVAVRKTDRELRIVRCLYRTDE